MTVTIRSPFLRSATRITAVLSVAAVAVLAPIRMAEGAPKTRFAELPAGLAGPARVAAAPEAHTTPAVGPVVAPPPGPRVDSPFPLSHLGVRWFGSETAAVDVRLGGPGDGWGPWRPMRADHDLEGGESDPVLSELILARGATRAQVRASGDARDVEILAIDTRRGPRSSRLAVGRPAGAADGDSSDEAPTSDGGEDDGSDVDRHGAALPSSTTATTGKSTTTTTTVQAKKGAVPQPSIVTRAEWGADESIRKNDQKYAPITKLFVHHTVTGGADEDPAATVRAVYAYHVQGRGWDDIGYNFLVDHKGNIYEGRWARDYAAGEKPTGEDVLGNGVVGAQVEKHNAGSAGVALLGDYTNREPTAAARDALVAIRSCKADRHDTDVERNDPFTTSGGAVVTYPNLAGHRGAGQSACPGNRLYPLLPDLRDRVARLVTAVHGPTTGYWTATADGRVLNFGDAVSKGSMAGQVLSAAITGMAATPTGGGYWLLGSDGGIFSFGDARFYGSTGALKLNKPVVGMAPTVSGKGYWLVASDGGIFSFADAAFFGSTGAIRLNKPVVGMAPTPTGKGYWLLAADGGLFSFGDAAYFGSLPGS